MLSSVTPMVALTATVAAAVWLTYERNTAFDGGILADNLARHHGAVLAPLLEAAEAGIPILTGDRADPDMRPFQPMHDWQSTVFLSDGKLWLVTYPVDFPADTGNLGAEVMQRIPGWMEREDTAASGYGLWDPSPDGGTVAGREGAAALDFDDPTVPQIGEAAPVIVTRIN